MADIKRKKKPRSKKSEKKDIEYDFLPPELEFTGKKLSNQKA